MIGQKVEYKVSHREISSKKMSTLFYEKRRSDISTENFLAFRDFEYSKFLNGFLRFS